MPYPFLSLSSALSPQLKKREKDNTFTLTFPFTFPFTPWPPPTVIIQEAEAKGSSTPLSHPSTKVKGRVMDL
jgi:hypothetical protein